MELLTTFPKPPQTPLFGVCFYINAIVDMPAKLKTYFILSHNRLATPESHPNSPVLMLMHIHHLLLSAALHLCESHWLQTTNMMN